ncbi:MAG: thiamine phosphate synthase [Terriglobales bacterium]
MADRCLLYYITDRTQFPGDQSARRRALLAKIGEAARSGVDYIQLREKDLSARQLEKLATDAVRTIHEARAAQGKQQSATRLLINSRTDVALAAGADGVHLRSDDISAATARSIWQQATARDSQLAARGFLIAVSCHSASDVIRAESDRADFVVFAPVFGKTKRDAREIHAQGIDALRAACTAKIPVLALGGVTLENAASCLAAGAAGIAGIRLFQENKIEDVIRALRVT